MAALGVVFVYLFPAEALGVVRGPKSRDGQESRKGNRPSLIRWHTFSKRLKMQN